MSTTLLILLTVLGLQCDAKPYADGVYTTSAKELRLTLLQGNCYKSDSVRIYDSTRKYMKTVKTKNYETILTLENIDRPDRVYKFQYYSNGKIKDTLTLNTVYMNIPETQMVTFR
jgi:hypothetical protein